VKEYAKIRISNWLGIAYQLVAKYRLSHDNKFPSQKQVSNANWFVVIHGYIYCIHRMGHGN